VGKGHRGLVTPKWMHEQRVKTSAILAFTRRSLQVDAGGVKIKIKGKWLARAKRIPTNKNDDL